MRLTGRSVFAVLLLSLQAAAADPPAAKAVTPLVRACELVGGRLASVGAKTCLRAGFTVSGISSVRGVPLLYRDYAPHSSPGQRKPPRVLMIGGIHGDELTAVSLAFQWMQKLDRERLQPFRWRVIPYANPDGLLVRPSTRTNANGIDLNRNFPTKDWDSDAVSYWKKKAKSDPRRYPGKKPASEPETRWLIEQIRAFKPDAIVSIHAPYGVLDYDGNEEPPKQFGYLRLQPLGTYPGSLGNYGYNINVQVITLELPSAGNMPTAMQVQRIWGDMLTWLEQNLPAQSLPEETKTPAAAEPDVAKNSSP